MNAVAPGCASTNKADSEYPSCSFTKRSPSRLTCTAPSVISDHGSGNRCDKTTAPWPRIHRCPRAWRRVQCPRQERRPGCHRDPRMASRGHRADTWPPGELFPAKPLHASINDVQPTDSTLAVALVANADDALRFVDYELGYLRARLQSHTLGAERRVQGRQQRRAAAIGQRMHPRSECPGATPSTSSNRIP